MGVVIGICPQQPAANHFLFPSEAADDRIVPYVQRWGDPPGPPPPLPRKAPGDCLLLLGLRSGADRRNRASIGQGWWVWGDEDCKPGAWCVQVSSL